MPRGYGYGAGMGRQGGGYGCGRGFRGNMGTNCQVYPWLPRRWWAVGEFQNTPVPPAESEYLQSQARLLKTKLGEIEGRLAELSKSETESK